MYEAAVRYSYSVEGSDYTSRISFYHHESGSSCDRQAVVERYANQTQVVVYYNPKNPDETLLKRGMSPIPFAVGAISIAGFAYIVSQLL